MNEQNIPQPPPILTIKDLYDEPKMAAPKTTAINKLNQMKTSTKSSDSVENTKIVAPPVSFTLPELPSETPEKSENRTGYKKAMLPASENNTYESFDSLVEASNENSTRHMSSNPEVTVESLKEFMKSDNAKIRAAVAANPATPLKLILALLKDKDSSVLAAIAGNPTFLPKYAPKLLKAAKNHPEVNEALKARTDLPEKFTKRLP